MQFWKKAWVKFGRLLFSALFSARTFFTRSENVQISFLHSVVRVNRYLVHFWHGRLQARRDEGNYLTFRTWVWKISFTARFWCLWGNYGNLDSTPNDQLLVGFLPIQWDRLGPRKRLGDPYRSVINIPKNRFGMVNDGMLW